MIYLSFLKWRLSPVICPTIRYWQTSVTSDLSFTIDSRLLPVTYLTLLTDAYHQWFIQLIANDISLSPVIYLFFIDRRLSWVIYQVSRYWHTSVTSDLSDSLLLTDVHHQCFPHIKQRNIVLDIFKRSGDQTGVKNRHGRRINLFNV